ncbi:formin-2 [Trichonephila clavipes]|nr:formin-2 [Trichonephila clavipes]
MTHRKSELPTCRVINKVGDNSTKTCLWQKLEEAVPSDIDEFTELFSRQTRERKAASKTKTKKDKTKEVAKLLDQKRSQNVGILISSLRIEIADVENAVYNFDTSTLDLDALQALYEIRPTPEELQLIKSHLDLKNDIPLDKPEHYTADFKLNAVEKANEVGNREATRFFNVDESNIRLWRRNKTNFENCDRRKRADRRGKPHWPELEAEINK